MSSVCPSCGDWSGWVRYCLAVFSLVVPSISALAECPDIVKSQVVYVEVCESPKPPDPPCKDVKESATGMFIAKNGLILSVYELLGKENVDLVDNSYRFYISKTKTEGDKTSNSKGFGENSANASVVGFDKRRGLLLLKISQESFKNNGGIIPAPIGEDELKESMEVCYVGFSRLKKDPEEYEGEIKSMGAHLNYQLLTTKHDLNDELKRGSPVYSLDSSGSPVVVGIASGYQSTNGKWNQVIPIEYADVLIGRVFREQFKAKLAKISSEIPEMQKQLKALSKQQEWSFREKHNDNCQFAIVLDKSFTSSENIVSFKPSIQLSYTKETNGLTKQTDLYEPLGIRLDEHKSSCLDDLLKKIKSGYPGPWSSVVGATIGIVPVILDGNIESQKEPIPPLRPNSKQIQLLSEFFKER